MTHTNLAFADFSSIGMLDLNQNELEDIDGGCLFVLGYIAGVVVVLGATYLITRIFMSDGSEKTTSQFIGGGGTGEVLNNDNNY